MHAYYNRRSFYVGGHMFGQVLPKVPEEQEGKS